ncbi:nucleotidyltransferase family protein [Halobaculum gomorrense]|uniref:Molybdenum cofactor cytidylyltransferase n=1 Tax=Halobaculum gomorrense TaxID=43928 RepID=A0A1M5T3C1_9EURY|nr:nucleotidyltransferase family protein [Halobaculum gomorrense]SHH45235.1 molybdenum cofactor cytidylyltransferase [Halobaculum gomorrense]
MSGEPPPIRSVPPGESTARDGATPEDAPRVAGVVLAAGTSSRYGDRNKLLEPDPDGDPLVRAAARTPVEAGLDPVVVVVGHEADRVADAVDGLGVETVTNEAFAAGQSTSVAAGVRAVADRDPPVDAAVVALGDMPFVDPAPVRALVDAYAAGVGDALAPAYEGRRGNPVLFDRRFFAALDDVEGDVGGRAVLLGSNDAALVAVDDPGVRRDVDEPGDL